VGEVGADRERDSSIVTLAMATGEGAARRARHGWHRASPHIRPPRRGKAVSRASIAPRIKRLRARGIVGIFGSSLKLILSFVRRTAQIQC
jgi:hypothetical protein